MKKVHLKKWITGMSAGIIATFVLTGCGKDETARPGSSGLDYKPSDFQERLLIQK